MLNCFFYSFSPLLPCLQLWEDKDAKQKLSKVNARVCMVSLHAHAHMYSSLGLLYFLYMLCVHGCVYPTHIYSLHFPTLLCLYVYTGLFSLFFFPFCVHLQALGTLKQKVRKYNKDFEDGIQSYRENPVSSDAEQAKSGE